MFIIIKMFYYIIFNMNKIQQNKPRTYFQRLGDSVKGILFGFILVVIACILLFWNEGRTVKMQKTIDEGRSVVVNITPENLSSENEDKLVHLQGDATTQDYLIDTDFNISYNAIKLKRIVEMYQWVEIEEKETITRGDETETKITYRYEKQWSDKEINSSNFNTSGYYNPSFKYKSTDYQANNVRVGKFQLSNSLINKISNYTNLSLNEIDKNQIPNIENLTIQGDTIYIKTGQQELDSTIAPVSPPTNVEVNISEIITGYQTENYDRLEVDGNKIIAYKGDTQTYAYKNANIEWHELGFFASGNRIPISMIKSDNRNVNSTNTNVNAVESAPAIIPEVGDMKIRYEVVQTPTRVSIIARQTDNSLGSYTSRTGNRIEMLKIGSHSSDDMFSSAESQNNFMKWFLRLLGFIIMLMGFNMIMKPIVVIVDVVPILNGIVGFGIGVIAFLLTVIVSFITIAIAWFYYRPLLSIALIAIAVLSGYYLYNLIQNRKLVQKIDETRKENK